MTSFSPQPKQLLEICIKSSLDRNKQEQRSQKCTGTGWQNKQNFGKDVVENEKSDFKEEIRSRI